MSKVKQALTRKFGPLPAWAWAVIAGAGIWWWRRKQAAQSGGQDQSGNLGYYGPYGQSAYPIDGGAGTGGGSGGGPSGNGGGGPSGNGGGPGGPPEITVNYGGKPHKRQRKHKPQHHKKSKRESKKHGQHEHHRHPAQQHNGHPRPHNKGATRAWRRAHHGSRGW